MVGQVLYAKSHPKILYIDGWFQPECTWYIDVTNARAMPQSQHTCSFPQSRHLSQPTQSMIREIFRKCALNSSYKHSEMRTSEHVAPWRRGRPAASRVVGNDDDGYCDHDVGYAMMTGHYDTDSVQLLSSSSSLLPLGMFLFSAVYRDHAVGKGMGTLMYICLYKVVFFIQRTFDFLHEHSIPDDETLTKTWRLQNS